MLADNLTVWENIVLGQEPGSAVSLKANEARKRIAEIGKRYGLSVDPDELISDLGVGDKQRVEILKVLYRGATILILDEPTAVLVPQEVDELFASLRELTDQGATIVFISHKLDEVLRHADAITVIRQGKTVGEIDDPSTVTAHDLAELMVGSELPTPETRERTVTDESALELDDVGVASAETGGRDHVQNVTFTVHRGEIVGIAGVEGNGQSELVRAILGLLPSHGSIRLDGRELAHLSTRERRGLGLGYIAEDRHRDGLVLPFTLWENAALGHHHKPPFARGPWLDVGGAKDRTDEIIQAYDVRTPGVNVAAFTLSGGNQQKLIVGREMTAQPSVLVAAHPTRGVDVGAQALIWDILRDARAAGLGTVAHLRRPGGADRLVRPVAGDAPRSHRRRGRSGDGHAVGARRVHDRRCGRGALMFERIWRASLAPLIAGVAAIIISSVALLLSGHNPVTTFQEMWKTIDSTESVVLIINRAVPYYIAGVAVAVGFKMNLFNIGSNGQYLLAALVAGWAGAEVSLPPLLHVPFIFLVAVAVGGTWALIAGVLNVTRNVNVVISTIMLNYIAIGLSAFLLAEVFRDNANGGLVAQTKPIPDSGQIPALNPIFEFFGFHFGSSVQLYGFLPFAIALGIGYHVLLNRSLFGYELKLSGLNADAATSAGVNPKRMVLITMFLSGAVAGMIGLPFLLADPNFQKYGDAFPTTIGFTGLGLALLGRNSPIGIAGAALIWATIERATQRLGPLGVPPEIGRILQGSFLLVAVIAYEVVRRRNDAAAVAAAAAATSIERPPPRPGTTAVGAAT